MFCSLFNVNRVNLVGCVKRNDASFELGLGLRLGLGLAFVASVTEGTTA